MDGIATQIRSFITQNLLFGNSPYSLPDEASFLESGIIDSMNVMELAMYVEEKFGITVDDEDIVPGNFDSISHLVRFIERKRVAA